LQVVRDAIGKATDAAGFSNEQTPSSDEMHDPSTIHSFTKGEVKFSVSDYVAIADKDQSGCRTWYLGVIHKIISSSTLEIIIFSPMGNNRVSFLHPEEDEIIEVVSDCILPLSPSITQSVVDDETFFVCSNHEELDILLNQLLE
jgi:hypothetical protein